MKTDVAELCERLREEAEQLLRVAWSRTDGGHKCCLAANLATEAAEALSQQADLIEKLREGLEGIRDLCDEEIRVRFGGHPHMSIEQCGRKSKIYALLVLPRNLAREALTTIPDTMRDEK